MAFASSVSNLPFVADELVPAEEASSDCNREGFSTALFLEFSSLNICEESLRSGLLKISDEVDFVATLLGIVLIRFALGSRTPMGEAFDFLALVILGASQDSDGISDPRSSS